MSETPLLLENVSKSYHAAAAVRNLSFSLSRGRVCGLLGPNGSGKTTTIRMVMGILMPDEGAIRLWGRDPSEVVRERVGYLPEDRGLYERMRLRDYLIFLGELHGMSRAGAGAAARVWLDRFSHEGEPPLESLERRRIGELSKGQQQTVQLIGTLLHDPDLVILDEPFGGLDPVRAGSLRNVVRELAARGAAVLLSTHRMEQAELLCDEVCFISKGELVLAGSLREVKSGGSSRFIELRMETPPLFFQGSDLIEAMEVGSDTARLRLRRDTDPQLVLAEAQRHGRVLKFEITEPSLDDLFVEVATR